MANPQGAPSFGGHGFHDITINNSQVHLGDQIVMGQDQDDLALSRLPQVPDVAFNSSSSGADGQSECLDGTRVDVRNTINNWVNNPSLPCIFWLCGMAGRGKTTIARTIAIEYSTNQQLGASFFFSDSSGSTSDPSRLVTTIASQLADSCSWLKKPIAEAIKKHPQVAQQVASDQWRKLILRPLEEYQPTDTSQPPPLVLIVLDALDECARHHGEILEFLSHAQQLTKVRLRILVTSRPEARIREPFDRIYPLNVYPWPGPSQPNGTIRFSLDDVPLEEVDRDISMFYYEQLGRLASREHIGASNPNPAWLNNNTVNALVRKADGLFIYAATICRYFQTHDFRSIQELLDMVIPGNQSGQTQPTQAASPPSALPTGDLDRLYMAILAKAAQGTEQAELERFFRDVIGPLALLFQPLSVRAFASLYKLPEATFRARLSRLHSVLRVPEQPDEPIRILHPSFRDSVTRCYPRPPAFPSPPPSQHPHQACSPNWKRDGCSLWAGPTHRFHVVPRRAHHILWTECMNRCLAVDTGLKQNICGLGHPSTRVANLEPGLILKSIPPELQYACVYWAQHLASARPNEPQFVQGLLSNFLGRLFVPWLEALSILGKYPVALSGLALVSDWLMPGGREPQTPLEHFVVDAKRFAKFYQPIAQTAPLQLYVSAFIFTPTGSPVRKSMVQSLCFPSWIRQPLPEVDQHWDPCLQVFEAGSVVDGGLAWSPTCPGLLAFGCRDGKIRLLDVPTNTVKLMINVRTRTVTDLFAPSIAFSPQGDRLAAVAREGGFRVFGLEGNLLADHAVCSRSFRDQLCFSPMGTILAVVFEKTIPLCDASTSETRLELNVPQACLIRSIGFSKDQKFFAAGAQNWVRIWDLPRPDAEPRVWPFPSNYSVWALTFSPVVGSTLIAIRFKIGLTVVKRTDTDWEHWIPGHSRGESTAVAFSPDGQYFGLLNHLDDQPGSAVTIWERFDRGHEPIVTTVLEYPYSRTLTFAFSPDGRLVATLSTDKTVKIWNVREQAARARVPHLVGDPAAMKQLSELAQLAFTPEDSLLISTSSTSPILRLWDPTTWDPETGMLQAPPPPPPRLRDSVHGTVRTELDGFTKPAGGGAETSVSPDGSIAIHPSGRFCASGLGVPDHNVVVWDIGTREASILQLGAYPLDVRADFNDFRTSRPIKFSPDGKLLGSTAASNILVLWASSPVSPASSPPTEWTMKHRLHCRSTYLTAFSFSSDSELIAVVLHDRLPDDPYPCPPILDGHNQEVVQSQRPKPYLEICVVRDHRILLEVPPNFQQPSQDIDWQGRRYIVDMVHIANGFFEPRWRNMDESIPAQPGGRLTVSWEDGWVRYDGENILWLPFNYRSRCFAVGRETVALARNNNDITLVRIDEQAIGRFLQACTVTAQAGGGGLGQPNS